jgi:UDP-glucose 4-epimerase
VRVLVTGGAGYVGGFTARHLIAAGHEVVVLDDLSLGHRDAVPDGVLHVGRIDDAGLVPRLLRERRIEAVLHFAASAYVGVSVREPRAYYRNNVAGSLALLEAMLDAGVARVVFSSTCSAYGESAEQPLRESARSEPTNPYAFSKLVVERMLADFGRAYGLRHVSLRYFNAAGASADGTHGEDHRPETHLVPVVLQTALGRREKVEIYGDDYPTPDGTCIRDYVHVEDLARVHARALDWTGTGADGSGEIFNVGTGTGSSVREVIQTAERVTGRRVPVEVRPRRAGDPPVLVASAEKTRRVLGWEPRHPSLEEIVATAWAWHRSHPNGYAS